MPGEQTEIYYLAGESRRSARSSRRTWRSFKAQGLGGAAPDRRRPTNSSSTRCTNTRASSSRRSTRRHRRASGISDEQKQQFQPLLDFLKAKLPDVKEARLTSRLKESAVCLVTEEGGYSADVERLMQRLHRDQPHVERPRVLEVNPEHPVVRAVREMHAKDASDARLPQYAWLLYDEALIAEGSKVKDPLEFTRRLNELLLASVATAAPARQPDARAGR